MVSLYSLRKFLSDDMLEVGDHLLRGQRSLFVISLVMYTNFFNLVFNAFNDYSLHCTSLAMGSLWDWKTQAF